PIHHHCKSADNPANGPQKCSGCGSDVSDQPAVEERLRRQNEAAVERARQHALRDTDERWGGNRARARSQILYGVLVVVFGTVITAISFASNSSFVVIAWGPILFGLILLANGLLKFWHS